MIDLNELKERCKETVNSDLKKDEKMTYEEAMELKELNKDDGERTD